MPLLIQKNQDMMAELFYGHNSASLLYRRKIKINMLTNPSLHINLSVLVFWFFQRILLFKAF